MDTILKNQGKEGEEEVLHNLNEDTSKVVSITEAARINNVTRQAIYVAIKQKKLRASKGATRWTINLDDLEEYRKKRIYYQGFFR